MPSIELNGDNIFMYPTPIDWDLKLSLVWFGLLVHFMCYFIHEYDVISLIIVEHIWMV